MIEATDATIIYLRIRILPNLTQLSYGVLDT